MARSPTKLVSPLRWSRCVQRLQLALAPLIAERAHALAAADPRTLCSRGVGASLAQLQHAELYSRLFRS